MLLQDRVHHQLLGAPLSPHKLISALLASTVATLAAFPPAQAEVTLPPSLVIIDTGIETALPIFQSHLIYEVCILDWNLCPNGKNFQEGPGTATLRADVLNTSGFDHGTQMASIALNQYGDLRFIMIRIVASNGYGNRMTVTNENVGRALQWVLDNREKFNIRAVSMSQGQHTLLAGSKYCPSIPSVQKNVVQLKGVGVGVFFPTGNAGDKKRIDWPACIPESIAIGAVNEKDEIPKYSNMDFALTDMYAIGNLKAIGSAGSTVNAVGTSISTQVAAVQWIEFVSKHPEANYSQIFISLRSSGKLVFDANFRFGRKIEISAALAKYEATFKVSSPSTS